MSLLELLAFAAVAICGTGVALTRDPLRQVVVFGVFGTTLTVLFFLLHAPDVALSELTVGTVAVPIITLIAIAKTTRSGK